jgi:hypothetical protein
VVFFPQWLWNAETAGFSSLIWGKDATPLLDPIFFFLLMDDASHPGRILGDEAKRRVNVPRRKEIDRVLLSS